MAMKVSFPVGDILTGAVGVKPTLWPVQAATETFGIVGSKGSGKTTTGRVVVEGLTHCGVQCVIVDPTNAWWGLKASRDGKSEGLPFTILGGPNADMPLLPTQAAGSLVAEMVVETDAPIILDLSFMRKAEQRRFMLGFTETLYHKMRGTKALMLVLDECDLYVPQKVQSDMAQLVGSIEDIVRRGRKKGLGCMLISQRPASINKDVLTQVSVLIAHRIASPQDRTAVDDWIKVHGDEEKRQEFLHSLHSQGRGNAWVWSPEWLDMFVRIAFKEPETFDSSATPEAGKRQIVPKKLAKADLTALSAKMTSIVEQATATDPKALQARIRTLEADYRKLVDEKGRWTGEREQAKALCNELRQELAEAKRALEERPAEVLTFAPDVEILKQAIETALKEFSDRACDAIVATKVVTPMRPARKTTATVRDAEMGTMDVRDRQHTPVNVGRIEQRRQRTPTMADAIEHQRNGTTPPPSGSGDELNGPMRKLLVVLATYGPRTKQQLALQAGYAGNGGAFNNPLSKLRSLGYVTKGSPIEITGPGEFALGPFEQLPSGYDLVQHWMNSQSVTGPMAKILQVLIDRWPRGYEKDDLAEATGYAPSGGAFNNPLSRLRTLGLVNKGTPIMLTEEFGEAIAQ